MAVTHDTHHAHAEPELGFWRKYVFSLDHKVIGVQYLLTSLFMAAIGGIGGSPQLFLNASEWTWLLPMPSTKRPPLSSPTVAASTASVAAVQRGAGITRIPVSSPPSTISAVASDHRLHVWKGLNPKIALDQKLAYP